MFKTGMTFILLLCIASFAGCGDQNEDIIIEHPQVVSISVNEGQELEGTTPITITFTKEMSQVNINVTGAKGTTTVDGKTATWNPSEISPGFHVIVVFGTDKSGLSLSNYKPVNFFTKTPDSAKTPLPQDPTKILIESSAADLWFQGNIGSTWEYSCNGELINCLLSKEVENKATGKRYKIIEESKPFISRITPNFGDPICPFLIFREDGKDRIVGFGEAANDSIESNIEASLWQNLKKADFPLEDLNFEFKSTPEWIVLNKASSSMGGQWTVASIETRVSLKSNGKELANGTIAIQGKVVGSAGAKVGDKNIAGVMVQYLMSGQVAGQAGGMALEPSLLCLITFAPNIGIISLTGEDIAGKFTGTLVSYKITPN